MASERYVILLRGINIGSRNRIGMPALSELTQSLGGGETRTYLQSGNVVTSSSLSAAALEVKLEQSIRRELGLDVTVFARTGEEFENIVRHNPLLAFGFDPGKLHVTFFKAELDPGLVSKLGERDVAPEEFAVRGREIYLHCPIGYGHAKLSNAFLERQFAGAATTRNWKTVTALAEMARE